LARARDESIEARVRDAAIAAVAEDGFAGLDVQNLCARAGISEAEFRARWPDAWEAAIEAIDVRLRLAVPDTGNLEDDLVAYEQQYLRACSDKTFVAFMFNALTQVASSPRVRARTDPSFGARRAGNLVLIERAVARGELPTGFDGNPILDGAVSLCLSWMGAGATPTEPEVRQAVRQLIETSRTAVTIRCEAAPTGREVGPYRLFLFATPPDADGERIVDIESQPWTSDDEAIAAADERRRGGYAELWRENHLLRIFEPEQALSPPPTSRSAAAGSAAGSRP
jgi:AcrR family transcriptional regulator